METPKLRTEPVDHMEQHQSSIDRASMDVAQAIHTYAQTSHQLDKVRDSRESAAKMMDAAKAYRTADAACVAAVNRLVAAYKAMFRYLDGTI